MKINKLAKTKIENTPRKVDVQKIYNKDSAQVMHITLQPGEALKPHVTPVDVFFYILEGTPEILVGKEQLQVQTDSLVESPKNIVHCIYNNSINVARVLVIKAPRPTSQSKLL